MMHRYRVRRPVPEPFFSTHESDAHCDRRLLLITMAFPPDQCTGALRWQKLSRYVAERGWGLDVITIHPASLASPDLSRLEDLPAGVRVYGVSMLRLRREKWVMAVWNAYQTVRSLWSARRRHSQRHKVPTHKARAATRAALAGERPGSFSRLDLKWNLASVRGLVRAYNAWLDYAHTGRWARHAAALALRLVDLTIHEAVITSGPPHMAHVAGEQVSRRTGLPLVIDMRDPWTLNQRLPEPVGSPLWFSLADRSERRAIRRAALVVTNTEPFRLAMCGRYSDARGRFITVMNGCDDDRMPSSENSGRFLIGFAGELYLARNPRSLCSAAAQVIREFNLRPAEFAIEMIGSVEWYGAKPVAEIAREEGLEQFVTLGPSRPRREALAFLAKAALLVSLPQDSEMAIPAKIFEYIQFDAWVLAMATPESATGRLLANSPADIVPPGDCETLVSVIRQRFLEHSRGVRPVRIANDARFSRRQQAERLLDAIAECVQRARAQTAPPALPQSWSVSATSRN